MILRLRWVEEEKEMEGQKEINREDREKCAYPIFLQPIVMSHVTKAWLNINTIMI